MLYLKQIKSEIKYRFCWLHPTVHHQQYHTKNSRSDTRCYELMYRILWFNVIGDSLAHNIIKIIDLNDNEDIKWMEQHYY